jgi:hypothetical protein
MMDLMHTLAHSVSSAGKVKYVCSLTSGACGSWQRNNAIFRADVLHYALATGIVYISGFWFHVLTFNDVGFRVD